MKPDTAFALGALLAAMIIILVGAPFALPGSYANHTPTVLRCEADYLEKCERDGYLSHKGCIDRAFEECVK